MAKLIVELEMDPVDPKDTDPMQVAENIVEAYTEDVAVNAWTMPAAELLKAEWA